MEIDMVKLVSFGVDAGHVMEELLGSAGVGEVNAFTVRVQPEADDAVMAMLREAAEGGWVIRVLDKPGGAAGPGDDIRISALDSTWLRGIEVNENGKATGVSVAWDWGSIGQLHIY
jgi:hypothetical protein